MVILLEKDTPFLPPPPPYHSLSGSRNGASSSSHADPLLSSSKLAPSASRTSLLTASTATAGPSHRRTAGIARSVSLPSHLLLHILYATLLDADEARIYTREEVAQRTTKVLYWMAASARRVGRSWYLASMHILRSTYLQSYLAHVKKPYTSDPFPHSLSTSVSVSSHSHGNGGVDVSPVLSIQRETQILDLFLLFHLRDAAHALDSALHLSYTTTSITSPSYEFAYTYAGIDTSEADDAPLRDLFDFMQPRARLADLVRVYGAQARLVRIGGNNARSDDSERRRTHPYAVPFDHLTVTFSPRKVGLALSSTSSRSTIVETPRSYNDTLERCASRLVVELKAWADAQAYRDTSVALFESDRDAKGNGASMRLVLRERAEAVRRESEKNEKKGKKGIRAWFGR